jgi:DNA-binding NarL/FixJ family response regulator
MQFIADWLFDNNNMVSALQVALDILVIALLLYHVTKPAGKPNNADTVTDSLQEIIDETRQISEVFEKNLQERQELMQSVIRKLDQEVRDAEAAYHKLNSLRKQVDNVSSTQISTFASSENLDILRLARTGMDARSIARKLQKPVGEVELILNLARISND